MIWTLHPWMLMNNWIYWIRRKRSNERFARHFIAFHSKFNKLNNTGAPMLESIYHMSLKVLWNHVFFLHENAETVTYCYDCHWVMLLSMKTTSGLLILIHGIILLPDGTSCENVLENISAYPSGTGTFFWAFGATGLRSPAKRAWTSSPTVAPLSCNLSTYFTSCTIQHA